MSLSGLISCLVLSNNCKNNHNQKLDIYESGWLESSSKELTVERPYLAVCNQFQLVIYGWVDLWPTWSVSISHPAMSLSDLQYHFENEKKSKKKRKRKRKKKEKKKKRKTILVLYGAQTAIEVCPI